MGDPCLTGGSDPAAEVQDQPKAARSDPGRRICRNLVRSGTHLSTRYCRTQAEWDEAGEGARRFLQEGRNDGSSRDGEMNATRGLAPPRSRQSWFDNGGIARASAIISDPLDTR